MNRPHKAGDTPTDSMTKQNHNNEKDELHVALVVSSSL